jgi:hypothetical protein
MREASTTAEEALRPETIRLRFTSVGGRRTSPCP